MKFPLPANTFPRVHLSRDDRAGLERLAQVVVDDTLQQYDEHRHARRGHVDTTQWKLVKHRGGVCVYKERRVAKQTTTDGEHGDLDTGRAAQMPLVMTVGTMEGSLDDVMYGVENHTLDKMRIKSSYADDGIVDCAALASILEPTAIDPLRSLSIKWCVKGRPLLSRPFVRFRDSVYIESTGITVTCTGERMGYQLNHSVEIPGMHELLDLGIVRARVSTCFLYRQRDDNQVELFMRGFLDPLGGIHPSLAIASLAEMVVSVWKNVHCAQMKKLTWMLSTTVRDAAPEAEALKDADLNCSICKQRSSKTTCRLCGLRVCSRCAVVKRLSLIPTRAGDVVQKRVSICSLCIDTVSSTSALAVASQEVERGGGFLMAAYDAMSVWSSSPSSSSQSEASWAAESLTTQSTTSMDRLSLDSMASSTVTTESFRSEPGGYQSSKRKTKPSWRC